MACAYEEEMPMFKCILLGDSGTGKTSFIRRQMTGEFVEEHMPTDRIEMYQLLFHTNHGTVGFTVLDMSGNQGQCDDCYFLAQCAIIMFDITARDTYDSIPNWHRILANACDNVPIAVCENKVDVKEPDAAETYDLIKKIDGAQYFDISVKANRNLEKPFLWLARLLVGDPDLKFVETPALEPAPVRMGRLWKSMIDRRSQINIKAEDEAAKIEGEAVKEEVAN